MLEDTCALSPEWVFALAQDEPALVQLTLVGISTALFENLLVFLEKGLQDFCAAF